jgi:acetyltransferase-like isoleucine patch superfamily enzyme
LRISVLRTLYFSARHGGQIIVCRGTRIHLERGARISLAPGSRLTLGQRSSVGTPCSLNIRRNGRLAISGGVRIFAGTRILIDRAGQLEIGDQTFIHHASTVTCLERVSIGSNCAISWNTNIIDGNLHELVVAGVPSPRTRPVRIGNGVWIGTGVIIVGATVGDGSIIGAGSVVTSEVPAKAVAAGNPARVVREDASWRM